MKFRSASKLHAMRIPPLRDSGVPGAHPCSEMEFAKSVGRLVSLRPSWSLRHLVCFKPLSYGEINGCSLDSNPLIFQSSAHCGVPGSNSFPLHPLNVAENPAPLVLPLALQEPYAHIYRYTPAVTNIGMGATGIHGSGAVGLPRHVPGSKLFQTVPHTSFPEISLT